MKNSVTVCSIVAAAAGTALASIAPVSYSNPLINTNGVQSPQGDPSGDVFFVGPGIGSAAGGFALASSGSVESVMGTTGIMGTSIGPTGSTISVFSSAVDNTGGNFDITIRMSTDDLSDLFPGGFATGGFAADTAGFFMGASAAGNPLDFSDFVITNSATIEIFDAAGSAGGPFDISGFANFSALGGGWDGSLGVTFGAGTAGVGIHTVELLVNVTKVPAPAGLATLALGGLIATRRRRA